MTYLNCYVWADLGQIVVSCDWTGGSVCGIWGMENIVIRKMVCFWCGRALFLHGEDCVQCTPAGKCGICAVRRIRTGIFAGWFCQGGLGGTGSGRAPGCRGSFIC